MISVTLLTKNSEKYLQEVLESLSRFDEVLIYDNGSTDNTLLIAQKFPNVKIEKGAFYGFGKTHNIASNLAKHDWILSIDSDEVVSEGVVDEIFALELDESVVYSVARENYYNGKKIKGCGWSPDRQYRLYHRKKTSFTDAKVHEQIKLEGMAHIALKGHLKHYSYDSIEQFLCKMQSYSTLFAEQNKGKKKSSVGKAILHGAFTFFKSFILKRGFLDGKEGFIISSYNAHTAFYKYLKLWEANNKNTTE